MGEHVIKPIRSRGSIGRLLVLGATLGALALFLLFTSGSAVQATSGKNPYEAPKVVDTNPEPDIVETTLVADEATVDIGGGVMAHAQTFNGTIPGPTFRLNVGDTVIVHFENHLAEPTGIHWHGIELAERERRHAVHAEPGRAGRHVPLQVQGHAARDLLVPPAPPLVDEPGLQGPVRDDRRQRPERGGARRRARAARRRRTRAARAQRHDGLQDAGAERRGDLRPGAPVGRRRRAARRRPPPTPKTSARAAVADRR